MNHATSQLGKGSVLLRLFIFSALYLLAAHIGEIYESSPESVTVLWPASGIFLAALLLAPRGQWPMYILCMGLIQFYAEMSFALSSIESSMIFTLALVLEATLAAYLIEKFVPEQVRFDRLRDVLVVITAACFLSIPLTAIPAAYANVYYFGGSLALSWWHWTLGDLLGVMVITPLMITLLGKPGMANLKLDRPLEFSIICSLSVLLAFYIFWITNPSGLGLPNYAYITFLPMLVVAFRHGIAGFSVVAFLTVAATLSGDLIARPESGPGAILASSVVVQEFLLVAVGTGLLLSAIVAERNTVLERFTELYDVATRNEVSLALTLNSIGDALIATDATGQIVRVNPGAEKLIGVSAREATGRRLSEVLTLSDLQDEELEENPVDKVLHTGEAVKVTQHKIVGGRDGGELYISDSAAPIRNDAGELLGTVMVARDVSEATRMRHAIEHQHNSMQKLVDALDTWVVGIDPVGNVEFANRVALDTLKMNLSGVKGRKLWELPEGIIPGFSREDLQGFFFHCLEGNSFRGEVQLTTRKGGEWVELRIDPVINEDGTPARVIIEGRIITELKKLTMARDAKYARSNAENAALQEIVNISAYSTTSLRGSMEKVLEIAATILNVEMISIWQLRADDRELSCLSLYNKSTASHSSGRLLNAEDYPSYFTALNNFTTIDAHDAANDPRTCEFAPEYLQSHDIKSMLDVLISVEGVYKGVLCCEHVGQTRVWQDDEISFARAVADNVSRLIAETRRFEMREEQRFMQKQLAQIEKMEALDQLSAGIAHDYNNMLNVVLGFSELLKNEEVERSKAQEYAEHIYHAADRGRDLTRKLMNSSRQEFEPLVGVDVNDLILNMIPLLKPSLGSNILVITDLNKELPKVEIVPADLEDAVMNISINAAHAMADGGEMSFISRDEMLDPESARGLDVSPGRFVCISITDTGKGISESLMDRILEPYFTTKGESGTGLGLAQVNNFLRRNGGAIRIDSRESMGSRFDLLLPVAEVKASSGPSLLDERLDGVRVLVVDDNLIMREFASMIILDAGGQVSLAENCHLALQELEKSSYDIVVTDQNMPGKLGHELAGEIARSYPGVSVVICSGEDTANIAFDPGYMVAKPYRPTELIDTIGRALSSEFEAEFS